MPFSNDNLRGLHGVAISQVPCSIPGRVTAEKTTVGITYSITDL